VVLSADATPEQCNVTVKIIETLKMIGYEHVCMILTKIDLNKEKRKDVMSRGFGGISPHCIFPLCNLDGYGYIVAAFATLFQSEKERSFFLQIDFLFDAEMEKMSI
jgi:hypothetical protein